MTQEDKELDLLIVLHPLFKELGSFKYFMTLKTTLTVENDTVIIKYLDLPCDNSLVNLDGYTKISHDEAIMSIKVLSPNILAISHNFEISVFEILPSALQNVIAMMVKTALIKIKICLESLTEE